jgi:copper chaperone CopZ
MSKKETGAVAIFTVPGMSVRGRAQKLRRDVGKLDGILRVDINYILDTVSIRYDADRLTLRKIKAIVDS